VKNEIFEVPFNKEKTLSIPIPDIQNKMFKVSKWFVKVGDFIEEGQVICELESNSITIEFDSQIPGKLVYITSDKEKLFAGEEICKIEEI
jgi:pyruvate/2-oxoglutarate dehydrogenase complex dihydrolipoamide acyltransferase (E2) component